MHILMIIDGLSGGGAEKMLLTLSKGLLSYGHQVSIFSLRNTCYYTLPRGVNYKIINDCVNKYSRIWHKLTEISRRAKALDKEILSWQKNNKSEFDFVISHLHKTDRIVACTKVIPRKRIWFCLHTIFSISYLKNRKGFFYWLKLYKIRYLYNKSNIIAVSNDVLKDIKQVFNIVPHYAEVIYNPFDLVAIRKMSNEPCELAGQKYIIHVSRLHKHKRQDRLLKAYSKSGIQVPLIIFGEGGEINMLKSLLEELGITNRVFFKGFNVNPYPYIRHACMLVVSSDIEGFGNVLVEALICNTPVVSTKCLGGPVDILSGELSICLSNLNTSELAKTMNNVYNNPPVILPHHFQKYDMKIICRKYIYLIQKNL